MRLILAPILVLFAASCGLVEWCLSRRVPKWMVLTSLMLLTGCASRPCTVVYESQFDLTKGDIWVSPERIKAEPKIISGAIPVKSLPAIDERQGYYEP